MRKTNSDKLGRKKHLDLSIKFGFMVRCESCITSSVSGVLFSGDIKGSGAKKED